MLSRSIYCTHPINAVREQPETVMREHCQGAEKRSHQSIPKEIMASEGHK